MPDREPIGVIGAGWVGLVTAACFAELGHTVTVREIVEDKVEALRRGEVPIYEPGLSETIERNAERLTFTTDMAELRGGAQLLFCCVDTPPTYSGDADLSRVERVLEELGETNEHALVMKSTVPVGTGRSIARRHGGLGYASNPEFLKEGTAVADFMHPDRVVVGAGPASAAFGDRVARLYEPLGAPIVRTDVASAEMIKLASNAFLATKISFINEIANVSEELGADVTEVARGMGLDSRIGPKFLQAGIGYGGSCLVGEETVLVRRNGGTWLWTLEEMWERIAEEQDLEPEVTGIIEPEDLQVLSWRYEDRAPEFRPVSYLTRRPYRGQILQVRTKMGRRVRCTPDHPFAVSSGELEEPTVKVASELTDRDWIPVALERLSEAVEQPPPLEVLSARPLLDLSASAYTVRPAPTELERCSTRRLREAGVPRCRRKAIRATGALRLDEAYLADVCLDGARVATAGSGTNLPMEIEVDEAFWRVVGLYIAEGHCTRQSGLPQQHLYWTFHPTKEMDFVREVVSFWDRHGIKTVLCRSQTALSVVVRSRLLAAWWTEGLGLGANCYEQRIPDLAWELNQGHKRALLAGMWFGDGSWSLINGGPSVILEYGTASRELADGTLRLLGDLGLVASLRVGRTAKSTCDNYWLRISGADQVERALFLVPPAEQPAIFQSMSMQRKRIMATGYRSRRGDTAWVRVTATDPEPFDGYVYSMEVPKAHTFVTTANVICHNCFPKDVSSLKQLAGNSGYHFQLLTSVIEVNELQKRRTIGKLQKHLGSLVGREIALLGLAFKPDTDDIREATSLVLAARLQGEGANVRVYDPVARDRVRELLSGVEVCESALDALDGADGAVLVTEWDEFGELDWRGEVRRRMARPLVVDGRNFLDGSVLQAAGFTYEGIGRQPLEPPEPPERARAG